MIDANQVLLKFEAQRMCKGNTAQKPVEIVHTENNHKLITNIVDTDKYGVLLYSLQWVCDDKTMSTIAILQQHIDNVLQKMTFLPENLALIELDEKNIVAQLRSSPPLQEARSIKYFECCLTGDRQFTLARFEKKTGAGKPLQVAFSLTREIFGRLVNDVITALTIRTSTT